MSAETYLEPTFILTSPDFAERGAIPAEYTCDGAGISPTLSWDFVPEDTVSFALVAYDPDAPGGDMTHWVLFNLPPDLRSLPAGAGTGANGGVMGKNGHGALGYMGPCPPHGTAPHRYVFMLMALNRTLDLPEGAERVDVESEALAGTITAAGLTGLYGRP